MNYQLTWEGNRGGDYLRIGRAFSSSDEARVCLEIGHCCLKTINAEVPVEFVTAILSNAIIQSGSIEQAILDLGWPDDFKQELVAKVVHR